MPEPKTNSQRIEMAEIRQLLRILYERTGYPAGCVIRDVWPYTGKSIPNNHFSMMRLIRQELLKRQVVQSAITDEIIAAYKGLIDKERIKNIFQARDQIRYAMDSIGFHEIKKPKVVKRMSADGMPQAHEVLEYRVINTKQILLNDRKSCWMIDKGDILLDAISGNKYSKSLLEVISLKERTEP